jgi:hypothetical protein
MTVFVSPLPKTWLIDIDGVIFVHNRHKEGEDALLPGTIEFFQSIPAEDYIILLTAREEQYRAATEAALGKFKLRYNHIVFGLPPGERMLINDRKLSGLPTAHAFNLPRDSGPGELVNHIIRRQDL